METIEHGAATVALAVALVNELTEGHVGGHVRPAPAAEQRPGAVSAALTDRPNRATTWVGASVDEYVSAAALAGTLRQVFRAAADDDVDEAARVVNGLLAHGDVRPVLSDHHGQAWHLHAHWDDAAPAAALRATCALGLAELVATGQLGRLGVCAADGCDRVFHDTSRNRSRRYHDPACQARAKTAAFRARRTS